MSTEIVEKKIRVGITHGDINGISYEVILKAFRDNRILNNIIPIIYGSPKVAAYYKKVMNLTTVNLNHANNINELDLEQINIINCVSNKVRVEIGKSTEMAGQSSVNALRHALIDLKNKKIDVLVTAPINKNNVQASDFKFNGHTDFFKTELNAADALMLMVTGNIRVAVVTEHIPISKISESITQEKILSKLRILANSMKRDFAIERAKIAVLSLNPHSGDGGLIGKEEEEIIIPAIEKAKQEGIIAIGPFAADGYFGSGMFSKFDATLAMYHDQGLAPFKVLADDKGVNFTAGLPIIRTSPAHGTAFDIAGKNIASPDSFIEAIYVAIDTFKNRTIFDSIIPMEKIQIEQGEDEDIRELQNQN